jgi:hypothetical protein
MQAVQRPTSITVLAVFHFIFGGVGMLCNLCDAATHAGNSAKLFGAAPDAEEEEIEEIMNRKAPNFQRVAIGDTILSLLASGALIAAGIGLLLMKSWARYVSLGWAAIIVLEKICVAAYFVIAGFPALTEMMHAAAEGDADLAGQRGMLETIITFMKVYLVTGPCLLSIYAVIVFVVLLTPTASAAFSRAAVAAATLEYQREPFQTGQQPPPGRYPPQPGPYPPGNYPPGNYPPGGRPDDRFRG